MASELSSAVSKLALAALAEIAPAGMLIALVADDIGELVDTLVHSKSPAGAVERAKQNALADAEDAAAEVAADQLLKHKGV